MIIGNILILRDKIHIEPYNREAVSYEYLSQLVAEHLLLTSPDVDISAALSIMPATRSTSISCDRARTPATNSRSPEGMDLNPLFIGSTSFRPVTTGGELQLFEQAGITLVHGWLVDPSGPEHSALVRTQDYDSSVNLLVEADHLTQGRFMVAEDTQPTFYEGPAFVEGSSSRAGSSSQTGSPSQRASSANTAFTQATYTLSAAEQKKVEDGL